MYTCSSSSPCRNAFFTSIRIGVGVRRLQLCQELNNIQQRDMSIMTYTLKIKEICDSLDSISVNVNDDEMVKICLGGLAPRFDAM